MMYRFRKLIAIVCALTVMLAMLSGCGSNSQNPEDAPGMLPDILGGIEDISPAGIEVSDSDQDIEDHKIVSARLDATFSCDDCPYINGEMTYTVITVTPYHNLLDAGIDPNDMSKFDINHNPYYWTDDPNIQGYTGMREFTDFINFETGELIDNLYLFIVEAEFTNINATETHYSDPYAFYAPIFKLVDRSFDDLALVYYVGYLEESRQYDENIFSAVEFIPGEPKTLHFGFWIYDQNGSDFSKMGLTYQDDRPFKDKSVFYWFNMSDVMAEVKSGME